MSTPTKTTQVSMPNPVIAVYTRWGYPASIVSQYTPDYAGTKANVVIIQAPTFSANSGVGPIFDKNGSYIGDANWASSLNQFVQETGVKLFYTLDDSDINTLAGMTSENQTTVMTWFKNNGFNGIDFDCESQSPMSSNVKTVTLAAIGAALTVTGSPAFISMMNDWAEWCSFVNTNGGKVGWLNLQCYSGGNGNVPAQWAAAVSPVPIVAGFEAGNGPDGGAMYPPVAQYQIAIWKAAVTAGSMTGAFVWDFGLVSVAKSSNYTLKEYAQAMYEGMIDEVQTIVEIVQGNNTSGVQEYLENQIRFNGGKFKIDFCGLPQDLRPTKLEFSFINGVPPTNINMNYTQGCPDPGPASTLNITNEINSNSGVYVMNFPTDGAGQLNSIEFEFSNS